MNKEKLLLKLRNMEYFVIKMTDLTTEEKIKLLEKIAEIKSSVEPINKGKEVNNEVAKTDTENNNSNTDSSRSNTQDEETGRETGSGRRIGDKLNNPEK